MNLELHEQTRKLIAEQLATLTNPCVACSFGKDSMVLLHFVREQMPDVAVLHLRHFEQPGKHDFADRVIQEWNLRVWSPAPRYRDFYGRPGYVELLNVYEIASQRYAVTPAEAQPALVEDETMLCAHDQLQVPSSNDVGSYDGIFIGQRYDDRDVVMGTEIVSEPVLTMGDFRYIYPLGPWTERDIWEATEAYSIPVNRARYVDKSVSANGDLWNLCTRCLETAEPVTCPKTGFTVPGMADLLDLPSRTEQIFNATLNLKGKTI